MWGHWDIYGVWVTFVVDVCAGGGGAREKVREMTMFKLSSHIPSRLLRDVNPCSWARGFSCGVAPELEAPFSISFRSPELATACNWATPNYRSLSYFGQFLAHLPVYSIQVLKFLLLLLYCCCILLLLILMLLLLLHVACLDFPSTCVFYSSGA